VLLSTNQLRWRVQHLQKQALLLQKKDREVDVDDPNFWNKIGIKEQEPEKLDSRRRKRTERFGMADDDEMAGAVPDEDDEYQDSSQYFHLWSKAARDKFVDAILAYGYGRWDMVKQDTEGLLNHRTEQDLKEYALGFILQCVCQATKSSKVPAGPQLVERVKKDVIHITKIQKKRNPKDSKDKKLKPKVLPDTKDEKNGEKGKDSKTDAEQRMAYKLLAELAVEPSLQEGSFVRSLAKKGRAYLQSLERLGILQDAIKIGKKGAPKYDMVLPNMTKSQSTTPSGCAHWWGEAEDKNLLIGVYLCGDKRYDLIKNHPDLIFATRLESLPPNPSAPSSNSNSTTQEDNEEKSNSNTSGKKQSSKKTIREKNERTT